MDTLIYFSVETVTPDPRQYNQQRQIYSPLKGNNKVAVSLEVNPENFVNVSDWYEKYLLWELGEESEKPELPEELICSPLGWFRVMEKLESPYISPVEDSQLAKNLFEGEPTDF